MVEKIPMTAAGFKGLEDELNQLKNVERLKISREIGVAREHGDLRENAEYHAAKEKQGMIEARIAELEDHIARADVIDPKNNVGPTVKFGAHVTLEDSDSGETKKYRIVGPDEADLKKGTISATSPVARALNKSREGDVVTLRTPGGVEELEILEVRYVAL